MAGCENHLCTACGFEPQWLWGIVWIHVETGHLLSVTPAWKEEGITDISDTPCCQVSPRNSGCNAELHTHLVPRLKRCENTLIVRDLRFDPMSHTCGPTSFLNPALTSTNDAIPGRVGTCKPMSSRGIAGTLHACHDSETTQKKRRHSGLAERHTRSHETAAWAQVESEQSNGWTVHQKARGAFIDLSAGSLGNSHRSHGLPDHAQMANLRLRHAPPTSSRTSARRSSRCRQGHSSGTCTSCGREPARS